MGGLVGGIVGQLHSGFDGAGRALIFVLAGRKVSRRLHTDAASTWGGIGLVLSVVFIRWVFTTFLESNTSVSSTKSILDFLSFLFLGAMLGRLVSILDRWLDETFRK